VTAYYNENDAYAAQWLRNLIAAGHITPGEVDERSIVDVRADDIRGFTQCHWFAGIGIWSYALRLASFPDDREVWTGSCPCQPFSAAGRAGGFDDSRHLWPHWSRLIGECRPGVVFGEQVASADGLAWLDFVCSDLEAAGYAVGTVDTCAAGFGAPHIRQRLYFVADRNKSGHEMLQRRINPEVCEGGEHRRPQFRPERGRDAGFMADSNGRNASAEGLQRGGEHGQQPQDSGTRRALGNAERTERRPYQEITAGGEQETGLDRDAGDLGDAEQPGLQEQRGERGTPREADDRDAREAIERTGAPAFPVGNPESDGREESESEGSASWECSARQRVAPGATNGFWRDAEWLPCIDGKARPVESGTFPLATVDPNRVGRLRAYGNAICAEQAAEFVRAYFDI
jgi:DNA (cytosine-5)-methyltransferase 1